MLEKMRAGSDAMFLSIEKRKGSERCFRDEADRTWQLDENGELKRGFRR